MGELTVQDIGWFGYDVDNDFARTVIDKRKKVGEKELKLVKDIEHAASGPCFGAPRRCKSDKHGEVLEIELYGNNLNIKYIQEEVKAQNDILLDGMYMIDDGYLPARLVIIVVDVADDKLWAERKV